MAKLDQAWTVEAHHGGSALAAELHRHMGLSHRQAKGLIDARCVKVNGEVATKHGLRLEAGDKVEAAFDPALKYDPIPSPKGALDNKFTTLWEDTHLLFVDKPAGLLTVPAEQGGEPSLADAVSDHYRRRGMKHAQLFIVHRLDRFTSGVLVFARTPEALHHLKKLFALHKLQRTYKAILVGELPENQGTLKGHLIEQAKTLKMRVVDPKRKDAEGSQSAVTHYRVVERLPGHTVVEVELETGRRNQIRVQFADRGFPLLGDHVYGEESPLLDRQALHAEVLGIKHPVTEQMVLVTAPLPKDFEAALKALRAKTRLVRAAAGEKGEAPKPEKKAPATDRPRFEKAKGDRPAPGKKPFRPRTEGNEDRPRKPFADRGAKPRFDKPERDRPASDKKPFRPRPEGDEDRPRKPYADRGAKPRFDKPERDRPTSGKKPFRPRPEGDEERSRKPYADRGAKPRFDKDAPRSPRTPRRDEGEARPRRTFGRSDSPSGAPAKPRREPGAVTGPRGAKPGYNGSKPRSGSKSGGKPSGPRNPFPKKRG